MPLTTNELAALREAALEHRLRAQQEPQTDQMSTDSAAYLNGVADCLFDVSVGNRKPTLWDLASWVDQMRARGYREGQKLSARILREERKQRSYHGARQFNCMGNFGGF